MNYRRVMRISSADQGGGPAGRGGIGAGRMRRRGQRADPAAAGPCSIIANGTPAPKTSAAAPAGGTATTSRNISTNPEVATGYRKDMTAVRTSSYSVVTANPLATQAACGVLRDGGTAADALVTAQAVLGLVEPQASGVGRRRVPALLRRRGGFGAGLRRPRGRARGRDGELSAVDLRHRPHRAQARCPRIGPVHRRARHPAAAAGRPRRARQDSVARPVQSGGHAGRRRLRHQPAAGGRHRRRRAAAEGRPRAPPNTSSTPTAAPRQPEPA